MIRLARFILIGILVEQVADVAYAVVPPLTSLEAPQAGMSMMDWFMYGSVGIVLCALVVVAVVLIAWLMRALFRR